MSEQLLGNDWTRAASVDDLGEGDVLGVQALGQPIALYRVEGEVYATHNICSHEFAHLSDGYLDGCEIECPLHQARFDIRTGKATCKPATEAVAVYPIQIVGNDIYVRLNAPG